MMENKFLLGVGYPIGIFPTDGEGHFKVEFNNDIYGIGRLEYVVWQLAASMKTVKIAFEIFKELTNKNDKIFFSILESLIESGLVIQLDYSNLEDNIKKVSRLKFIRQGLGNGLIDNKKQQVFNINLCSDDEIDLIQYLIWSRGNGQVELKEVISEFISSSKDKKKDMEAVLIAILQLYAKKLIIFKG